MSESKPRRRWGRRLLITAAVVIVVPERVADRAIRDMAEDAQARGEQVPSFVEEVKDTIRAEMIDAVVADDKAVQELSDERDDHDGPEPRSVRR